jgi:hypothetical protein
MALNTICLYLLQAQLQIVKNVKLKNLIAMVEIEFSRRQTIGEAILVVITFLDAEMKLLVCNRFFHFYFSYRGMNPPENNSLGACADGYTGYLCTDCNIGYSRTGNYECSACPDNTSNALKMIGLLIVLLIGLVLLIRSTL